MNLLSVLTIVMIGILAGMLAAISAMAILIGAFVKVPGAQCARYWAVGSSLILIGITQIMWQHDNVDFVSGMLGLAIFMTGHVLQWRGLQIFFFKPSKPFAWWIAGAFLLAYSVPLMNHASFAERLAFISLVPLIVWPLCLRDLLAADHLPYKFATRLGGAGLLIMILGALMELVVGLSPNLANQMHAQSLVQSLVETITPILGSLMYMAALVLLYFERAAEQTNFAATHDELTGLLNRRAIIAGGEQEILNARRANQSLVVAFVDIDFFKKINDEYGHDAGDLVLREVAHVLKNSCRSVDLVGRYGGEEFCLVFPGDHHGGAEVVGQKMVEAVRTHHFPNLPKVTISVGLTILPTADKNHTWHSLVREADTELYKVKHSGRDGYSIHGKPFPTGPRTRPANVQPAADQGGALFFYGA